MNKENIYDAFTLTSLMYLSDNFDKYIKDVKMYL